MEQKPFIAFRTVEGGVVADVLLKRIISEDHVESMGGQLEEQVGPRKLVVNFRDVEYICSTFLGKLITLNNRQRAAHGKLLLCGIRSDVYEVFLITNLYLRFMILEDVDQALSPNA